MSLRDEQIIAQNPWWSNPGWPAGDRQLALLASQPMQLSAELVATIDLRTAGIHVLRGPRQVGKTTDLKLLVQRALAEAHAARSIVYLTLDLIEGQPHAELAETIVRAKALARHPGASIVLLDEVTGVPRWQTAMKALWDDGTIAEDMVVCTGSSAIDLQQGAAERLPGRRGAGRDHLVLPQTFASFARAIDDSIDFVAGPRPQLDAVEVKYQRKIDLRSAVAVAKAHPGRPAVIATQNDLLFADGYTLVPAHQLLWTLGPCSE